MSVLEEALAYIRKGYSLVSVRENAKVPSEPWLEYQQRRMTEAEATKRWTDTPRANVGIITGRVSDLLVVDVDGKAGLHALDEAGIVLPRTLTIKTPKGLHFYYKWQQYPGTTAGLLQNVDIRNDGGFVVAPPSRTENGVYTIIHDNPIAVLGDVLPYKKQQPKAERHGNSNDAWVADLFINGAGKGERNSDLARLAGYLWKHKHPEDVMLAMLHMWNEKCDPPLPAQEVERTVHSITRYVARPF